MNMHNWSDLKLYRFFLVISAGAFIAVRHLKTVPEVRIAKRVTEVTVFEKSCKCDIKYLADTLIRAENFVYFDHDGKPKIVDTSLVKNICYK